MDECANELSCRGLVEIATDYLDGALAPALGQAVERHVENCEGCRRYLEQMRITVRTVGRLREDDVPVEIRERLVAAFREMKRG